MRTILVIDDHVPTLITLCLILRTKDYIALPAENAEQAQEKFAANVVDLVIVDHVLPGITGSELAGRFKRVKNVPVLMLTGGLGLREKPGSVDLLFVKPCSVPVLLEGVESLFAKQPDYISRCAEVA
jgi:DNA-binding response OmpR family regulator